MGKKELREKIYHHLTENEFEIFCSDFAERYSNFDFNYETIITKEHNFKAKIYQVLNWLDRHIPQQGIIQFIEFLEEEYKYISGFRDVFFTNNADIDIKQETTLKIKTYLSKQANTKNNSYIPLLYLMNEYYFDFLDNNDKSIWIIEGPIGSGKTTQLKQILADYAENINHNFTNKPAPYPDWFPVIYELKNYLPSPYSNLQENLDKHICNETDLSDSELQQLKTRSKIVFLFDGLDECKHKLVWREIENLVRNLKCKIILTTREDQISSSYDCKDYKFSKLIPINIEDSTVLELFTPTDLYLFRQVFDYLQKEYSNLWLCEDRNSFIFFCRPLMIKPLIEWARENLVIEKIEDTKQITENTLVKIVTKTTKTSEELITIEIPQRERIANKINKEITTKPIPSLGVLLEFLYEELYKHDVNRNLVLRYEQLKEKGINTLARLAYNTNGEINIPPPDYLREEVEEWAKNLEILDAIVPCKFKFYISKIYFTCKYFEIMKSIQIPVPLDHLTFWKHFLMMANGYLKDQNLEHIKLI